MSNIKNMSDRELMENIYLEMKEIKDSLNLTNSKFEQLNAELHTKVDILCNFKPANQKNNSDNSVKKVKITKLTYIKDSIKKDKNAFLDKLYTQEEYDVCAKTIEEKKLNSKKTEEEKLKQVADLLYKNIINVSYKEMATSLYNEMKSQIESQNEKITPINIDDESNDS